MWVIQCLRHSTVTQSLILPYILGRVFFSILVPPSCTAGSKSVVSIKPGGYGRVIGYKVDEFTHFWYVQPFAVQSHINLRFIGNVSPLAHFTFQLDCKDCTLLDPAVKAL